MENKQTGDSTNDVNLLHLRNRDVQENHPEQQLQTNQIAQNSNTPILRSKNPDTKEDEKDIKNDVNLLHLRTRDVHESHP